MRTCFAVIFLILFSFQVLPMKVLGKLLAKGQTEEEVKNSDSDGGDIDGKVGKYNDFIFETVPVFTSVVPGKSKMIFSIHRSDMLPSCHITEILSPPPNHTA